jgi:hypothetical protein
MGTGRSISTKKGLANSLTPFKTGGSDPGYYLGTTFGVTGHYGNNDFNGLDHLAYQNVGNPGVFFHPRCTQKNMAGFSNPGPGGP